MHFVILISSGMQEFYFLKIFSLFVVNLQYLLNLLIIYILTLKIYRQLSILSVFLYQFFYKSLLFSYSLCIYCEHIYICFENSCKAGQISNVQKCEIKWSHLCQGVFNLELGSFFFFSSTSLLLPTHLPPPSCMRSQ